MERVRWRYGFDLMKREFYYQLQVTLYVGIQYAWYIWTRPVLYFLTIYFLDVEIFDKLFIIGLHKFSYISYSHYKGESLCPKYLSITYITLWTGS